MIVIMWHVKSKRNTTAKSTVSEVANVKYLAQQEQQGELDGSKPKNFFLDMLLTDVTE